MSERASGSAAGSGGRARRRPKRTQQAKRGGRGPAGAGRREPLRAAGGSGSSSAAAAARMLTGRLCWVPLLLALGVGSGSGGGGGSRRRRLLAAKGGCWGSFLLSEEGGRAVLRVRARGPGLRLDLHALPCCSSAGLCAPGIPEVSSLLPERLHLQTPAQPWAGSRDGGEGEVCEVGTTLGGCLWRGGGVVRGSRAPAHGQLEQGAGAGRRGSCLLPP